MFHYFSPGVGDGMGMVVVVYILELFIRRWFMFVNALTWPFILIIYTPSSHVHVLYSCSHLSIRKANEMLIFAL